MTQRRGWLGNGVAAAQMAGERGDLWLPGALAALGYLAWLPLLVTVAGIPSQSDLAFLGAGIFSSGSFPLNLIVLAVLVVLVLLGACLVAAFGEAAILRASGLGTRRSLAHDTEVAFSIVLVAALPAMAVLTLIAMGVAVIAPGEFGAPDIGGSVVLRIAVQLVPLWLALAVAVVIGQAFGAATLRRAYAEGEGAVGRAMRGGVVDVVRNPLRRLGVAVIGTAADVVAIGLAIALLRVLWAPISTDLAGGELLSPRVLLLLVGFVAIWLIGMLFVGALHVWRSRWWSLELDARPAAA